MFDFILVTLVVVFLYKGLRIKQIRPIYNAILCIIVIPVVILCSFVGIKITINKEDNNQDNLPM